MKPDNSLHLRRPVFSKCCHHPRCLDSCQAKGASWRKAVTHRPGCPRTEKHLKPLMDELEEKRKDAEWHAKRDAQRRTEGYTKQDCLLKRPSAKGGVHAICPAKATRTLVCPQICTCVLMCILHFFSNTISEMSGQNARTRIILPLGNAPRGRWGPPTVERLGNCFS